MRLRSHKSGRPPGKRIRHELSGEFFRGFISLHGSFTVISRMASKSLRDEPAPINDRVSSARALREVLGYV